jgi:hypothetical protein
MMRVCPSVLMVERQRAAFAASTAQARSTVVHDNQTTSSNVMTSMLSGWTVVSSASNLLLEAGLANDGLEIISVAILPHFSESSPGFQVLALRLNHTFVGVVLCGGVLVERRYFAEPGEVMAWSQGRLAKRHWCVVAARRARKRRVRVDGLSKAAPATALDCDRRVPQSSMFHFKVVHSVYDHLEEVSAVNMRAAEIEKLLSSPNCLYVESILLNVSIDVSAYGEIDRFVVQTLDSEGNDLEPSTEVATLGEATVECERRMSHAHRVATSAAPEVTIDEE